MSQKKIKKIFFTIEAELYYQVTELKASVIIIMDIILKMKYYAGAH